MRGMQQLNKRSIDGANDQIVERHLEAAKIFVTKNYLEDNCLVRYAAARPRLPRLPAAFLPATVNH